MPIYSIYAKRTGKYGVKIFWLCDASVPYAFNGKINVGKQPGATTEKNLGQNHCSLPDSTNSKHRKKRDYGQLFHRDPAGKHDTLQEVGDCRDSKKMAKGKYLNA